MVATQSAREANQPTVFAIATAVGDVSGATCTTTANQATYEAMPSGAPGQ